MLLLQCFWFRKKCVGEEARSRNTEKNIKQISLSVMLIELLEFASKSDFKMYSYYF